MPGNSKKFQYRTRAIISRSGFEAALIYKSRILSLKYEELPFLVHKLSETLTALKNGVNNIQTMGYYGACMICILFQGCLISESLSMLFNTSHS